MDDRWPELNYAADRPVIETLHAYLQVIGKLPTRALPWTNHGWHVVMRVVPRGFRTYPVPLAQGECELLLDCLDGCIRIDTSRGESWTVALPGRTVAAVHGDLVQALRAARSATNMAGAPNEVAEAIPFVDDHRPRAWDADTVSRIHRAFSRANLLFEQFRTGFVGKSSPSHLFWGGFDLAVTRFSGRKAPLHRGGVPNLPDRVTREAYSHEVASAGFWLGGSGLDEAAFYAYGHPSPETLAQHRIAPEAAHWHAPLSEFVLPYAAVRAAAEPDASVLEFLQSGYEAVASELGWDRAALEIPRSPLGHPYDVAAWRGD